MGLKRSRILKTLLIYIIYQCSRAVLRPAEGHNIRLRKYLKRLNRHINHNEGNHISQSRQRNIEKFFHRIRSVDRRRLIEFLRYTVQACYKDDHLIPYSLPDRHQQDGIHCLVSAS